MKRLIALLLSGVLIIGVSLPVLAESSQEMDLNDWEPDLFFNMPLFRTRQIEAYVNNIDLVEKNIIITRGKNSQTKMMVNASNAVIIQMNNEGASSVSLSQLQAGARAHFFVKRQKGAQGQYYGLVIVQMLQATPQPSAFAPPNGQIPTVTFKNAYAGSDESTSPGHIHVLLSNSSTQDVKVDYTITGGTASASDYNLASGTLTIPAERTSAKILLPIIDDNEIENNETVILKLSNPMNATLGAITMHTFRIMDRDVQPSVSFSAASSSGGEENSPASIQVILSRTWEVPVSVKYMLSGTATGNGRDYTLMQEGTVTIPAGQTSGTISFPIVNDTVVEQDETVILTLIAPTNGRLGAQKVHTFTIMGDNNGLTVGFTLMESSGAENVTPVSVAVTLSAAASKPVTVSYAVTGSATGGNDYTLANGTVMIPAGQLSAPIGFEVIDDAADEPNETVIITLSDPVDATMANTTFTYSILDND